MKNSKYLVIFKTGQAQIPLGDLVRVFEYLKNQKVMLITNRKNFKFCSFFFKNYQNIENYISPKKNTKIINLVIGMKLNNVFFDINDFIKTKLNKKITYNIFNKLELKKKKQIKYDLKKKKKYTIGFNWKVPKKWSIKEYPLRKWKSIEKILNKNKKIRIIWQKKDNLNNYIRWLKNCDIIISVVGLGVHISSFYNKKIIMLSGPTDFYESGRINNIFKLTPTKRCVVHRKKLNILYKNCSCMKKINEEKIINQVNQVISNAI